MNVWKPVEKQIRTRSPLATFVYADGRAWGMVKSLVHDDVWIRIGFYVRWPIKQTSEEIG